MKNITSHTGTLEIVKRMNNSINGNPRYMLRCDGWTFCTQPDSGIAYEIENHVGKMVTVHIGTHYGRCQLKSLWGHKTLPYIPKPDMSCGKTQIVRDIAELDRIASNATGYYFQTGE